MGGLIGTPKAPPPRPVRVVQAPAPPPPPAPEEPDVPDEEEIQSERRRENLLRRNRGRLGTVLTGFRGLLSLNDNATQRKNLLGE